MWRSQTSVRATLAAGLILSAMGCEQVLPAAPLPPSIPPPANQAPQISGASVSPGLGIHAVTTFTVRADVGDADGDPLTVKMSGCPLGQDVAVPVSTGLASLSFKTVAPCVSTLTLTVSDGRGGSAETKVPFQYLEMRGAFRLVVGDGFYDRPYFYVVLQQNGATLSGTVVDDRGHAGVIDSHEATVDAAGRFRLKLRIPSEGDLVVSGQVVSAELDLFRDIVIATGAIADGLYAGRAFKLWREAQY